MSLGAPRANPTFFGSLPLCEKMGAYRIVRRERHRDRRLGEDEGGETPEYF